MLNVAKASAITDFTQPVQFLFAPATHTKLPVQASGAVDARTLASTAVMLTLYWHPYLIAIAIAAVITDASASLKGCASLC
jgi:hypothetical protein